MILRIEPPIISSALQPKSRSAAAFQEVTVPSSVLLTMASSDESMMAARYARASSGGLCVGVIRSVELPMSRARGGRQDARRRQCSDRNDINSATCAANLPRCRGDGAEFFARSHARRPLRGGVIFPFEDRAP